jgi:hypothetical protein
VKNDISHLTDTNGNVAGDGESRQSTELIQKLSGILTYFIAPIHDASRAKPAALSGHCHALFRQYSWSEARSTKMPRNERFYCGQAMVSTRWQKPARPRVLICQMEDSASCAHGV